MTSDLLFNVQLGDGKPVVCLHGWGMHSGIFIPLAQKIQDRCAVSLIDLPGHGHSDADTDLSDLSAMASLLKSTLEYTVDDKVVLLASSMSGLIAQQFAAQYPDMIDKLVLVSGTPCFAKQADWAFGMEPETLALFSEQLESNYQDTLDRFLALQYMGSDDQKAQLRQARELIAMKPVPHKESLRQGLQLLTHTDLRAQLSAITCPTLLLSGERDKLVPTTAIRYMAQHLSHARAVVFKGCGHAPFLSHLSSFTEHLLPFIHD
jgi:pimeloyl-[acyl-carrier protein] methyl ester esterase